MGNGSHFDSVFTAVLFVVGALLMLFALLGGIYLCRWSLAPVSKRGLSATPIQFRIVDLAGLVAELSVLAGIVAKLSDSRGIPSPCPLVLAGVLVGCCWWVGVRLLSHSRVDDGKRRLTMHLIVIPVTILCSAYLVLGALMGMLAVTNLAETRSDWAPIVTIVAGFAVATLLMAICRKLSAWIARGSLTETVVPISLPPAPPGL